MRRRKAIYTHDNHSLFCSYLFNIKYHFIRYEYDMFIEANMHTIALLEPIAKKIAKMGSDERARFKLEPGLGSRSMIYQRVIKKVYEGDKCAEVLDALHNNPAM